MAKSQEERRARDREYKRAWRKENPEAERSRKQAYSEANREKLKESSLSYYARNKEACNKRARDYYRRNRFGASSNGKTGGSNPPNLGSNPSAPAIYVDNATGSEVDEDWWPPVR